MFRCPKCGGALTRREDALQCAAGHSYDIARQGYVHLAPAGRKSGAPAGDNPQMTAARTKFLETGSYAPLADALVRALRAFLPPGGALLDAGCGEGYYTARLAAGLKSLSPKICGVDLSRSGVRHAARSCPGAHFAVASIFSLPLPDACLDGIVSVFCPLCPHEFRRVLKSGGRLLVACPAPLHLFEMKRVLYESPYENEDAVPLLDGFHEVRRQRIQIPLHLEGAGLVQSLFMMTPYYYKTPALGAARLAALERLDDQADFYLAEYEPDA